MLRWLYCGICLFPLGNFPFIIFPSFIYRCKQRWFRLYIWKKIFNSIWLHYHISVREFLPIVIALEIWSVVFQNFSVVLHCDNSTVVQVINKTSSKNHNLMKLMRRLMILSLKYNIHFPAYHFLGVADMLSRLQVVQFKMRFPYMEKDPIPVPQDSLRLWNKPSIFYYAVHCHHHL